VVLSPSLLILLSEASITHAEAALVLKVVFSDQHGNASVSGARSAQQLLNAELAERSLTTFCPQLDEALGLGVPAKQITEFCGVPGVGKTQLGIQLAVAVQIPRAFGGLQGEAVYIDTEGSFTAERARDMAAACAEHVRLLAESPGVSEEGRREASSFTAEAILGRIHLFRVHDSSEQEPPGCTPLDLTQQTALQGLAPTRYWHMPTWQPAHPSAPPPPGGLSLWI